MGQKLKRAMFAVGVFLTLLGAAHAGSMQEDLYRAEHIIGIHCDEIIRLVKGYAAKGNPEAQDLMGFCFIVNDGMDPLDKGPRRDYKLAAYWYGRAASQGYASSQMSMGMLYEEGLGTPQDFVVAYAWYNLAAANDGISPERRDKLAGRMTALQIAEGQEIARKFIARPESQ